MLNKSHSLTLIFVSLLFLGATSDTFAEVCTELEQAKSDILSLIRKNDFAGAQVQTQQLIVDSAGTPDCLGPLYDVAEEYEWASKFEEAKNIHQQIEQNHPDSPYASRARLGIARVGVMSLIMSQESDHAGEALDKLVTDFPGHPDLPDTLDRAAQRYGWFNRFEDVKSTYQKILQNYPDSPYASKARIGISRANVLSLIMSQRLGQARGAIDKLVADFSEHPDLPETLYCIAERYIWFSKFGEAKDVYQQIVQNHSDSPWASKAAFGFSRAAVMSLIVSQEFDRSREALDKLVTDFSEHPDLAETLCSIAERYEWFSRFEDAKSVYQRVVQSYPDSLYADKAKLYVSKADVMSFIMSENYTQAEGALDKLITDFSGNPDLPEVVHTIGTWYYNHAFRCEREGLDAKAKEYFQRAIVILERAVAELPESTMTVQAYYYAANCCQRLGQFEKAINYYKKVVDNWPGYEYAPNARFKIGHCYEGLKGAGAIKKSAADAQIKAAYEQALEKCPNCPAAKAARNWLKYNVK